MQTTRDSILHLKLFLKPYPTARLILRVIFVPSTCPLSHPCCEQTSSSSYKSPSSFPMHKQATFRLCPPGMGVFIFNFAVTDGAVMSTPVPVRLCKSPPRSRVHPETWGCWVVEGVYVVDGNTGPHDSTAPPAACVVAGLGTCFDHQTLPLDEGSPINLCDLKQDTCLAYSQTPATWFLFP